MSQENGSSSRKKSMHANHRKPNRSVFKSYENWEAEGLITRLDQLVSKFDQKLTSLDKAISERREEKKP